MTYQFRGFWQKKILGGGRKDGKKNQNVKQKKKENIYINITRARIYKWEEKNANKKSKTFK